MKNYTGMKIAKKYEDKIEEIHKDMDGVWAYAAPGFYFESSDTHTERQDNQKDLYKAIQTIAPCECKECESMKAAPEDEIHNVNFACKVNTIDELIEMPITRGERFYITEMVTMSEEEIEHFSYNMLSDWEFLKGKGGMNSTTFPASAEGKESYFDFTEKEKKEFQRGAYRECVGITTPEGGGMLIIDPQGYSYARYSAII